MCTWGKTNDTAQTVEQAGVASLGWTTKKTIEAGRQRQREVEISQGTLETQRMEDFEVLGLHNTRSMQSWYFSRSM